MKASIKKIEFVKTGLENQIIVTLSHGWEVGQVIKTPCDTETFIADLKNLIVNIVRYTKEAAHADNN